MTIHKCDVCGKEVTSWLNLEVSVQAKDSNTNVGDILHYDRAYLDMCKDCFEKTFNKKEK